jgi:hypothetical protein
MFIVISFIFYAIIITYLSFSVTHPDINYFIFKCSWIIVRIVPRENAVSASISSYVQHLSFPITNRTLFSIFACVTSVIGRPLRCLSLRSSSPLLNLLNHRVTVDSEGALSGSAVLSSTNISIFHLIQVFNELECKISHFKN